MQVSLASVRDMTVELLHRLKPLNEFLAGRLDRFLEAVRQDRLSSVVGLVSLLLLFVSFFLSPGAAWAAAALATSLMAVVAYRIWDITGSQLEALKVSVRLPSLNGHILEVQITPGPGTMDAEAGTECAEQQCDVFVRMHVANQGAPTAVTSFLFISDLGKGRVIRSNSLMCCGGGRATLSPLETNEHGTSLKVLDLCEKLSHKTLGRGREEEGWLWFAISHVGREELAKAKASVILTDAFQTPWSFTGEPPWRSSGLIQVVNREAHHR